MFRKFPEMKFLIHIVFAVFPVCLFAVNSQHQQQEEKHKGTFYFEWGYNKDWFSKSDIHFVNHIGGEYDFTLYDVKADDRPSFNRIIDWQVTIPQFLYRFGYYFNNKHDLGIEIGFDHTKYVVIQNQTVHITGSIHGEALDKDTIIQPGFLLFEHTNGANFLMASLLKRTRFFQSGNGKHVLSYVLKPGAGIVIPKTDVTLFGKRRDNVYHVAGYIAGLDIELRYETGKHWFAETGLKGSFANYVNVLTIGDAKANHHFYSLELLLSVGYAIPW